MTAPSPAPPRAGASRATYPSDVVIALVYGLVGVVTYLVVRPGSPVTDGPVPVIMWLPCVVIGAALVMQRRRVGTATVALALLIPVLYLLNGGLFAVLLLGELAYAVALFGTGRQRSVLMGYGLVVAVAASVSASLGGGSPVAAASVGVLVLSLLAVGAWWGGDVRDLGAEVTRERERAELQEALATAERDAAEARTELAHAEQRAAVGRDLHDVVAGRLAAMSMQTARLLERDLRDDATRRLIAETHDCAASTLEQVREMITRLSSPTSEDRGRAAPVGRADLTRTAARGVSLGLELTLEDEAPDPGDEAVRALRVVAQEAVANALEHAAPCRGRLRLTTSGKVWVLEVVNELGPGARVADGRACAPAGALRGHGLVNMRSRVAALGGQLEAGEKDGVWRLRATVPVETAAVAATVPAPVPDRLGEPSGQGDPPAWASKSSSDAVHS